MKCNYTAVDFLEKKRLLMNKNEKTFNSLIVNTERVGKIFQQTYITMTSLPFSQNTGKMGIFKQL